MMQKDRNGKPIVAASRFFSWEFARDNYLELVISSSVQPYAAWQIEAKKLTGAS
jgi:hypothetical protein